MQLHITLKNKNTVLPIAYRYFVQSMIYNAVESDAEFSRFLHDGGYMNENRSFKLFTFSPLSGNYLIENKKIMFYDKISLEIRSSEPAIIQSLICALKKGSNVNIGRNTLTVEKCILKDKIIYQPSVKIKTVSPLTAYVTRDYTNRIYFSPEDGDFNQLVVNNAKRKWLGADKSESEFDLSFKPIGNMPFRKEVTTYKKSYVTAWHGGFELKGNPEVINFLYNTGLGSGNSKGFGMFELIE